MNEKDSAPYGIIFQSPNKVIVGVDHIKKLVISDDLMSQIKNSSNGLYYYEGAGGDNLKIKQAFGDIRLLSSWDKMVKAPSDKSDLCYTIFSTIGFNTKQIKNALEDKTNKKTILDMLELSMGPFLHELAKGKMSKSNWTKFLKNCKEDFFKLAQLPATKKNVSDFIDYGNSRMWPHNWESYPNPSGKVALRMSQLRDKALIGFDKGVYFTGHGHLKDIIKIDRSLKIVDGRDIK